MCCRAPTGYVLCEEITGGLAIEPVAAAVMRDAVRLYVDERLSLRATAAALNAAGHRTRLGNMFKGSSLRLAFRSPLIAGLIELDDGTLTPCAGLEDGGLLTAERWRELRLRIDSRKGARTARRPATTLLSAGSVLRCSGCGGALTPERRGERSIYRCANRSMLGGAACAKSVTILAAPVDQFAVVQACMRSQERRQRTISVILSV